MKPNNISNILLFFSVLLTLYLLYDKFNSSDKIKGDNPIINKAEFTILPDTARSRIERYARFTQSIQSQLGENKNFGDSTKYLVYGQKVQIDELKHILVNAADLDHELYIMTGINNQTQETDMIFSLHCTAESCNDIPIMTWDYFDFTQPCPQFCPEWLNIKKQIQRK